MEVDDLQTDVKYIFVCNRGINRAHRWYKIYVKKPFSCVKTGYHRVNDKCEYFGTCQKGSKCKDPNTICTGIYGRYSCLCKPGYTYNSRDKKCKDVDECAKSGVNTCDQECINTPGSFECGCRKGFTLQDKYCKDIDECQDHSLNKCENPQKCFNVPGSYRCYCPDGYKKKGKFSCKGFGFGK